MHTIQQVLEHYGFHRSFDNVASDYHGYSEYVHPTALDERFRNCLVMVLGPRAIVHCKQGLAHYSISSDDVEYLLRKHFECFDCQPRYRETRDSLMQALMAVPA